MNTRTCPKILLILSFGIACTEDPLVSRPATGTDTDTTGAPTSFDPPPLTTGAEPTTTGTPGTTSTGEPATDTAATAPDAPTCGDGVVAGDEQCDLGEANADTGACTLECKHATCGDGLVWADIEECDFGLGNDDSYGGCLDCQLGPHCGDGTLDPEYETCDRGELNGTGITTDDYGPCDLNCGYYGRKIFITEATYPGALGGVSGGDVQCVLAAQAAGFPNFSKYRAWLSDEAMAPIDRFSQWDAPGPPLILVNGRVVADDFEELADFGPRTGISRTEVNGILFDAYVWTNTSAFGGVFSATHHCAGWTSNSGQLQARVGRNALAVEAGPEWQAWRDERWWTSFISLFCVQQAHLYCVDDSILLPEED